MSNLNELIEELSGRDDDYANALKLNTRMFRNRVGIVATFSSWSGRRVQDARELSAFGIRNTEEYLLHRTKGAKLLVPAERITNLSSGKTEADGWMSSNFMQIGFLPGVYAVPRDQAKEVRDKLITIGATHQARAYDYTHKPINEYGTTTQYDIDRENMVGIFSRECGVIERSFFESQYPSPAQLASKYRAKVVVVPIFSPSVGDAELDRAQAIMIAAEARELSKEVSLKLRAGVVECLQSFTEILGGKKPDSKINERTIRSVRAFFERARTLNFVADPILENAISLVEGKFASASSFTREELESLGIREAVSQAVLAASDHATALRNVEDSMDAMMADDWDSEVKEAAWVPSDTEPDCYIA